MRGESCLAQHIRENLFDDQRALLFRFDFALLYLDLWLGSRNALLNLIPLPPLPAVLLHGPADSEASWILVGEEAWLAGRYKDKGL